MAFEIITWFYSVYKNEDKKFPPFIQKILGNNIKTCPNQELKEGRLWIFINISEIDSCEVKDKFIVFNSKGTKLPCSFQKCTSPTRFIILRHDFSSQIKICLEGEEISLLDFDYSEDDPDYHEQWKMINNALNWEDLDKIVDRWILCHQVDPLRRIKHRAINLYLPICTDIQFLLEIWRRKDFPKAKTHLEELKAEWIEGKSPVSILYRLWYMLVGDHLNWKKCAIPEKPADVSLPKDREGNELPLYDWLTKYLGEKQVQGLEQWQKLIAHAQIDPLDEEKFIVKSGKGVYCFSMMITEKIEKTVQIIPEAVVNGIEQNKNLEVQFNLFLDWLNDLNDNFESLITQCQRKS